ncbi:MAG: oxidoreductase [Rhodospirillales bacterium CG15_BIG_FIL_POST_REV_8_21_14_020_66_15]|nr:MAG: oxidoreductase [Rhodospirillales bacterium CG15_BIG_FIL_POST_REV_8_21_14_020_66_15]
MTKLLKDGKIVSDPWVHVADRDEVPESGPVIVTLARWQAEHNSLAARKDGLGIRLQSGQSPETIKDDLDRFAVVALEFPRFADGRAYSHARVLKTRLGYAGEVRAVGDVLRDQFRAMHRCGFDALEVAGDRPAEALEADWWAALGELHHAYQPALRGPEPVLRQRHRAAAA